MNRRRARLLGELAQARAAVRTDLDTLIARSSSTRPRWMLAIANRGQRALAHHRYAVALRRGGVPIVPELLVRRAQRRFGIDIALDAELAPGITIVHGVGLVVGAGVRVASGCSLYHGVTLGKRLAHLTGSTAGDGFPTLEAEVVVGAGATILGAVTVGRGALIGANALVTDDVDAGSVVAAPRAVVVRRPVSRERPS